MAINNAEQASELVKSFLQKMGWSTFISPQSAVKADGHWVVIFTVGLQRMRFEISAPTGEILKYETLAG